MLLWNGLRADADGSVRVIAAELGEAPNNLLVGRCGGEAVSPVVGNLVQVFPGVAAAAVVAAPVEMVEPAIHLPQRDGRRRPLRRNGPTSAGQ